MSCLLILLPSAIFALWIEWTFTYDGPDSASDHGRAIDRSGNSVCIVGDVDMGTHDDAVVISVNAYNGDLNWATTFGKVDDAIGYRGRGLTI